MVACGGIVVRPRRGVTDLDARGDGTALSDVADPHGGAVSVTDAIAAVRASIETGLLTCASMPAAM
jgi:hypothetical protein